MKTGDKISIAALIMSGVSIIVSGILSLYIAWQANDEANRLAEYQLQQERLPRIVALNYELPVEIANTNGEYIDFSSVSPDLYPIKIPVYNIGVASAQNCSITWKKESINEACADISSLLSNKLNVHEYEKSAIGNESGIYWASQDIIFSRENKEYDAVSYCKYFSSDDLLGYDCELAEDDLMCEDVDVPYILPISQQSEPVYVELSNGLSILLLEIANQKIYEPITFCFDINYQDLTGLDYRESVQIEFCLKDEEEDNKTFFEVSFESVQELP